jgi:hypothetical protein
VTYQPPKAFHRTAAKNLRLSHNLRLVTCLLIIFTFHSQGEIFPVGSKFKLFAKKKFPDKSQTHFLYAFFPFSAVSMNLFRRRILLCSGSLRRLPNVKFSGFKMWLETKTMTHL